MRSLRARIAAYLGLAVLISMVLTVGVAALLTRRNVEGQALVGLERQADAVVAAVGDRPPRARPLVFTVRAGRRQRVGPAQGNGPFAREVLAMLPASGNRSGRIEVRGRQLLYAARDTPSGRVVVVRGARLAGADFRPFAVSLLVAGLGGAAVAAALSLLLARRLSRPVLELSSATRRLASGSEAEPVPVRGRDELATLARSFNAMAGDLQAAREAQRTFLMSVSHELKTPLTAVRGYAEGLGDGAVDPDEAARVIAGEAGRLERLVADLLDLARLERGQFSVARCPLDTAEVARGVAERFAPRARELGVVLEVDADGRAPATGDPDRLVQAISNLVENGLRVTPAGRRVTIRAHPGEMSVSDQGPGLAAEDLPRAFDRFYLHTRYGSDRAVGSGLGLAIVRELVGAMGGEVEVRSPAGAGATFTVRLPGR